MDDLVAPPPTEDSVHLVHEAAAAVRDAPLGGALAAFRSVLTDPEATESGDNALYAKLVGGQASASSLPSGSRRSRRNRKKASERGAPSKALQTALLDFAAVALPRAAHDSRNLQYLLLDRIAPKCEDFNAFLDRLIRLNGTTSAPSGRTLVPTHGRWRKKMLVVREFLSGSSSPAKAVVAEQGKKLLQAAHQSNSAAASAGGSLAAALLMSAAPGTTASSQQSSTSEADSLAEMCEFFGKAFVEGAKANGGSPSYALAMSAVSVYLRAKLQAGAGLQLSSSPGTTAAPTTIKLLQTCGRMLKRQPDASGPAIAALFGACGAELFMHAGSQSPDQFASVLSDVLTSNLALYGKHREACVTTAVAAAVGAVVSDFKLALNGRPVESATKELPRVAAVVDYICVLLNTKTTAPANDKVAALTLSSLMMRAIREQLCLLGRNFRIRADVKGGAAPAGAVSSFVTSVRTLFTEKVAAAKPFATGSTVLMKETAGPSMNEDLRMLAIQNCGVAVQLVNITPGAPAAVAAGSTASVDGPRKSITTAILDVFKKVFTSEKKDGVKSACIVSLLFNDVGTTSALVKQSTTDSDMMHRFEFLFSAGELNFAALDSPSQQLSRSAIVLHPHATTCHVDYTPFVDWFKQHVVGDAALFSTTKAGLRNGIVAGLCIAAELGGKINLRKELKKEQLAVLTDADSFLNVPVAAFERSPEEAAAVSNMFSALLDLNNSASSCSFPVAPVINSASSSSSSSLFVEPESRAAEDGFVMVDSDLVPVPFAAVQRMKVSPFFAGYSWATLAKIAGSGSCSRGDGAAGAEGVCSSMRNTLSRLVASAMDGDGRRLEGSRREELGQILKAVVISLAQTFAKVLLEKRENVRQLGFQQTSGESGQNKLNGGTFANESYGFSRRLRQHDFDLAAQSSTTTAEASGASARPGDLSSSAASASERGSGMPQLGLALRFAVEGAVLAVLPVLFEFPDVAAYLLAMAYHPLLYSSRSAAHTALRSLLRTASETKAVEDKEQQNERLKQQTLFFTSVYPRLHGLALDDGAGGAGATTATTASVDAASRANPLRPGAIRAVAALYRPAGKDSLEKLLVRMKEKLRALADRVAADTKSDAVAIFFQDEKVVFHSEYSGDVDLLQLTQVSAKNDEAATASTSPPPKQGAKAASGKVLNAPKGKAKAKAAPGGGSTSKAASSTAAASGGKPVGANKGAMSKEEINELKLAQQLELRQRMRSHIKDAEFLLDLFDSFAQIPAKCAPSSLLERHVPEFLPGLMVLLGSPLTALSTVARLRGFVRSVVPKTAISTRCLLPDILQVVARNELAKAKNAKHLSVTALVDTFFGDQEEGARSSEAKDEDVGGEDHAAKGADDSSSGSSSASPLLALLHGVSHENALTAGGFSFLTPVLIQILTEAAPQTENLCSLALQTLARQLAIVSESQLALLTASIRMSLLEGLFTCIFRLPRVSANCRDTLEVICRKLVATEEETTRIAAMYLQCSEMSRKQVLLPGMAALLHNYFVMRTPAARQTLHACLLIAICEERAQKGPDEGADCTAAGNGELQQHASAPSGGLATQVYDSLCLTDELDGNVLADLLLIIRGQLPAPIVEPLEIQRLGGSALLFLLEAVAGGRCSVVGGAVSADEYVRNGFAQVTKAYGGVSLEQTEFCLSLQQKRAQLDAEKKAAAEVKKFVTANAPKSALQKEIDALDDINRNEYWTAKWGLALVLKQIYASTALKEKCGSGEELLRFLLNVALHDHQLQDLELVEKPVHEDVRSTGDSKAQKTGAAKPAAGSSDQQNSASTSNMSSDEFAHTRVLVKLFGDLRETLIAAGLALLEILGKEQPYQLAKVVDALEITAATPEGSQLGAAVFYGALGKFLDPEAEATRAILPRLFRQCLDEKTSVSVQLAIVKVLPPLVKMQVAVEKAEGSLVKTAGEDGVVSPDSVQAKLLELLDVAFTDKNETVRRGAALACGAVVKGLTIAVLKQQDIVGKIDAVVNGKSSNSQAKQGAIMCLEGLTRSLGRLFEPYVIMTLPILLKAFADSAPIVRLATQSAAKAIMGNLSAHGIKLVLPHLLEGIDDKQWRTKLASIEMLASMVQGAPKQLSVSLPKIVPILAEVVNDTHAKVKDAGKVAMQRVGEVVANPEIQKLAPQLLASLSAVNENSTRKALDALLTTSFVHNVDAPSLALLCPIVLRALRERSAEMKRKGAQIIGSMVLLIKEPKDMQPHLPVLIPALKIALIDPIPDVRATSAKAFGTLAQGLPEELLGDLLPWLFQTLKSKESPVERSGAAHGLSEVLMALGASRVDAFLPDLLETAAGASTPPEVKEGYLGLFVFLPATMGGRNFEKWFQRVLDGLLRGMREEYQTVRDVAFRAAGSICKQFGASYTALVLPPLEEGLFEQDYRIRHASVLLLMNVIEAVLKANRMNTNNVDLMSAEVMPPERRAYVLSSLYIVRSDESAQVKQAATSAWKQLVQNTPRCVRELLPILMRRLIHLLASASREKQVCASRCVGELVGKLGDRVLPELMPIFFKALTNEGSSDLVREGVCIGLTELINNCGRQLLSDYVSELLPAVQQALCDNSDKVRAAASKVASLLYTSVGASATTPIVAGLLKGLATGDTRCLDGLEQLISRQHGMALPVLLDTLCHGKSYPPWKSAAQLHGLATVAKLEDENTFYRHVTDVLEPILDTLAFADESEFHEDAVEAARKILLKVGPVGANIVLGELAQCLSHKTNPRKRAAGGILLRVFFEDTSIDLASIMDIVLDTLLPAALSDPDPDALRECHKAFGALIKRASKDQLTRWLPQVRELILKQCGDGTVKNLEEKGKVLPGLALVPSGLEPFYPIYQQGLLCGQPEAKLVAAQGLGELVDHTTFDGLKPFVVKITGPLIRIVGDKFSPDVKLAILETLEALLQKGQQALRPFLPQLQTTFLKCLGDAAEEIRTRAAQSLAGLAVLSPRVDSLLQELANGLSADVDDKQRGSRTALVHVLESLPQEKLKDPMLTKVRDALGADASTNGRKALSILSSKWPA
eukprot:g3220.t1